uniref:AP2/ERF domain-containing protein n=1 Tax=Arundo donax TaxID=35708 RepID=A0A0A8YK44_ARUDO
MLRLPRSRRRKLIKVAMVKTASSIGSAAAVKHGVKRTYKGVRMRSWGSWVSEVRELGQKTRIWAIWLGFHSNAEAAALLCLKGCSAAAADLHFLVRLLFDLPAATMSPKAIQRVAAASAGTGAVFSASADTDNASGDTTTAYCSSLNDASAVSVDV